VEIGEDIQECRDFDWFCVDDVGEIGHFATAGYKRVPRSVATSLEDLDLVAEYFCKELRPKTNYLVDQDLELEFPDPKDRRSVHIQSFVEMAERGLYSFDIASYLRPNINYFRVAVPITPLSIDDLPKAVREIVSRTVFTGRLLRTTSRIPYVDTLDL